jgi:hypothetical protein
MKAAIIAGCVVLSVQCAAPEARADSWYRVPEAMVLVLSLTKAGVVLGEFYGADAEGQCFTARNATERALETAYAIWRPDGAASPLSRRTILQCKPKS